MSEGIDMAVLLEALKELRNELRQQRALAVEAIDQGRMLERCMDAQLLALNQRIRELKEELEQTIRAELLMLVGDVEPRAGRH